MSFPSNYAIKTPVLPTNSNSDIWVKGSYNNPFSPGSLEYDGYQKAYNINYAVQSGKDNIKNSVDAGVSAVKDSISDLTDGSSSTTDTTGMFERYDPFWNSASAQSPSSGQQLQYVDAPYASAYGMDASTAYHEALANTAYQRKVKDLQAAGLNPVLGISGSGAESFYGTPAASSFGGVSYGSSGSGKTTDSLSETATKLGYWLPTLVNGVTNMAFTLGTKNGMTGYAAGTIAQNIVSGALGAIRNHA